MSRLSLLVAAATLAAACALGVPARGLAAAACGSSPYSYAGMLGSKTGFGVSATITPLNVPRPTSGHVAAWVGVGGEGLGPNGTNEWLQAGISAEPDNGLALYYELALPNTEPKYVMLKGHLDMSHSYRVAVTESPTRRGWWSVAVNGTRVTKPMYLAGSHGAWRPVATTESWNGGVGACNTFAFRFANLSAASQPSGGWSPMKATPMHSPGFKIVRRDLMSFVASGGTALRTPTAGH